MSDVYLFIYLSIYLLMKFRCGLTALLKLYPIMDTDEDLRSKSMDSSNSELKITGCAPHFAWSNATTNPISDHPDFVLATGS